MSVTEVTASATYTKSSITVSNRLVHVENVCIDRGQILDVELLKESLEREAGAGKQSVDIIELALPDIDRLKGDLGQKILHMPEDLGAAGDHIGFHPLHVQLKQD